MGSEIGPNGATWNLFAELFTSLVLFLLYPFQKKEPIDPTNVFVFSRLYSYLGGAGPACADVTGPEHLLVAQDAAAGVLLVVQELLEGGESVLGARGAGKLLQQPADLIGIIFHLERTERKWWGERRGLTTHPHTDMSLFYTLRLEDFNDSTST